MITDRLDMKSIDFVSKNIESIAELFPNCITETLEGKRIDFTLLQQELSGDIVDGAKERYRLEWAGKREAIVNANLRTTNTLRPIREDSVDFDKTENIYIEGDNLEVLKILQESYLNKIKMIYIDPPYNTGNDFIYKDDFKKSVDELNLEEGNIDEQRNRLVANSNSSGRYHSDWLSMMYPRLKLARNLLTEDGVIFISIDDNEVHNLRKICDEIFGEMNFVDIFNWVKTETPENLSKKSKQIIEYILCYQKNKNNTKFKGIKKEVVSSNGLLNQSNAIGILKFPANIVTTSIPNQIVRKGIYGTDAYVVELLEDTEVKDNYFIKEVILKAKFKWTQQYLINEISKGTTIRIPKLTFSPSYEKKEYDPEVPANLINSKVGVETNESAGVRLYNLFGSKIFNYPKPSSLIEYLLGFNDNSIEISQSTNEKLDDFIVLDFFAGSSTTAEAIFNLNTKERNNKLKFILVQINENLSESLKQAKEQTEKEILKNAICFLESNNLKPYLCEIGKERIRRAGNKIIEQQRLVLEGKKEELDKKMNGQMTLGNEKELEIEELRQEIESIEKKIKSLDCGFRVFRLDSSNMKDVYYMPKDYTQENLELFATNIKEDRKAEDLVAQVMLDWGLELSKRIEKVKVLGKEVYKIEDNSLYCCFDEEIDEKFIRELAKQESHPLRIVFKDSSFKDDTAKENVAQLIKQLCPETEIKVI